MSPAPSSRDLPRVSVIGRPNVGKSTLFNRLSGTRRAIVDAVPGVTRDRLELPVEWRGRWFLLCDTGGIDFDDPDGIARRVVEQARVALAESRVVIFLVDARAGANPVEADIADVLRRSAVPVIVAANKVDGPHLERETAEFHALGVGPVLPVSAEQGRGVDDLLDAVLEALGDAPTEAAVDAATHVAVIGRPNVGKSSLVNRLLGEERVIVSEVPGTTRDAVDARLRIGDREFVLVDTAGLKRKGTDSARVEHVARVMASRAVARCDVALLLFDAHEGPTHQDAVIAGMAVEAGVGLVLVGNKWDLVADQERRHPELVLDLRERIKFAPWAPFVTTSVRTGERVHRLFGFVEKVETARNRRIPTAELNAVVEAATRRHQPPQGARGKEFRVKYLTQVGVAPPTFVAFTTGGAPHFTWQRFLENRLRESFDLEGTPVVIRYRGRGSGPSGSRRGKRAASRS